MLLPCLRERGSETPEGTSLGCWGHSGQEEWAATTRRSPLRRRSLGAAPECEPSARCGHWVLVSQARVSRPLPRASAFARSPLPPALALFFDKLLGYSLFACCLMVLVFVCLKGVGWGATYTHVEKPRVSLLLGYSRAGAERSEGRRLGCWLMHYSVSQLTSQSP